jgi:hypothetical protein
MAGWFLYLNSKYLLTSSYCFEENGILMEWIIQNWSSLYIITAHHKLAYPQNYKI